MTVYYSSSLAGFVDPDVVSALPADAVEITTAEYVDLLNGQSAGKRIVPDVTGRPVLADPPSPSVEEVAAAATAEVRRQAAATRDAWRTPGKDAVYRQKVEEAAAWRAAGEPIDVTPYPHIAAEVGITAPTAADLVALWEAMAAAWIVASAQVEATEQAALKAIRDAVAADDAAAVEAALVGLSWPLP
jgi:hypothetical protein